MLSNEDKKAIKDVLNIDANYNIFNPMVDFAFKRMFTADEKRSKIALLDFINSVLEFEGENTIEYLEVINPEIPNINANYKKSIFDIRAKTKNGEQT
jgi:hypothetical protein